MLTIRFNRVLNELVSFFLFHHHEVMLSVLFRKGLREQVKIGLPNEIRGETSLIREIRPYVPPVFVFQIGCRRAVIHEGFEQLSPQ